MEKTKSYYVYIATNQRNTVLYTGVTNNITRRMYEHKNKLISGFTKKYNVNKLIFCEEFSDPVTAINNEKKIKGWLRKKKIDLIKKGNPDFRDLSSWSRCSSAEGSLDSSPVWRGQNDTLFVIWHY